MWDLSSPTRDGTCTLCIVNMSLTHCTARGHLGGEEEEFPISGQRYLGENKYIR